jgi:glycosyltransferase involved in cell wall biosynthesis
MACGCPVVSSDAASLPEVCGDAAVYVDPASTAGIARGIAAVLADGELRARLRGRGMERARGFTYEHAAEQVMAALEEVRC